MEDSTKRLHSDIDYLLRYWEKEFVNDQELVRHIGAAVERWIRVKVAEKTLEQK